MNDTPLTTGTRVREAFTGTPYDRGPWGGVLLEIDGSAAHVRWDAEPEEHWPGCMPPEFVAANLIAREVVHVLHHGSALCDFMRGIVPGGWPPGHVWTRLDKPLPASCAACVRRVESLRARMSEEEVRRRLDRGNSVEPLLSQLAELEAPLADAALLLRQRDYWRDLARRISIAYVEHVGCEADPVAMEALNPKEPT